MVVACWRYPYIVHTALLRTDCILTPGLTVGIAARGNGWVYASSGVESWWKQSVRPKPPQFSEFNGTFAGNQRLDVSIRPRASFPPLPAWSAMGAKPQQPGVRSGLSSVPHNSLLSHSTCSTFHHFFQRRGSLRTKVVALQLLAIRRHTSRKRPNFATRRSADHLRPPGRSTGRPHVNTNTNPLLAPASTLSSESDSSSSTFAVS